MLGAAERTAAPSETRRWQLLRLLLHPHGASRDLTLSSALDLFAGALNIVTEATSSRTGRGCRRKEKDRDSSAHRNFRQLGFLGCLAIGLEDENRIHDTEPFATYGPRPGFAANLGLSSLVAENWCWSKELPIALCPFDASAVSILQYWGLYAALPMVKTMLNLHL